jgi:hypothetical protein
MLVVGIKKMEEFEKFTSAVQNIFASFAIIIAGFWTYFTFRHLRTKNKADAELASILLNVEKEKRNLVEHGILEIEISAKQIKTVNDENYCIAIIAKFTNKGNSITSIDLTSNELIIINEVLFDSNGMSYLNPLKYQAGYQSGIFSIRAGATTKYPFFVMVNSKGIYTIDIFAKVYDRDSKLDTILNENPSDNYWTGGTYVEIN